VTQAIEIERLVGPAIPDVRTIVVDLVLRFRVKRAVHSTLTPDGLRRSAAMFARAMNGQRVPAFVAVEPVQTETVTGEWITVGEPESGAVLYFHGGGFYMCSPRTHRPLTWRLARATKRRVCTIAYRKAPDHAFPAWVDDGVAAYHWLLEQGYKSKDILFSGDSAGGNIALAVTHRLRRSGAPLPAGLILLSPWADLGCQGESYRRNARRDAMFQAKEVRSLGKFLTRESDPRDPEGSPVHADLTGFPPLLVFAGSTEVFLDDARTIARNAKAAGVPVELYVYRHMPHVFPFFASVLPRANLAFQTIARFAERPSEPVSIES
jgi:monoterpene epsilon-lactone hydrolase